MAELKSRLQSDLTEAIRARDKLTAGTLRMALTAVRSVEVAGSAERELSDEEVTAVLVKEAKRRREAAEAFTAAGRSESADQEMAELAVLEGYLPAQLADEELAGLVAAAVAEVTADGAGGMAAMGRVMKTVQAKVAGRAEGGRVAAEVRRQLA